tara:strand:+ start:949 stop:1077 length:129 start_codon:yes stop_codon:yes gene_type:complete
MTEILVELKDYYLIGEVVTIDNDNYEVIEIDYVNQLAVLEKL